MSQLILRSNASPADGSCGLCGQPTQAGAGTQLVVADTNAPVCLECGRKHAPSLVALVTLADAAERVGRIGRHTVFPPLTAMLDLVRAAENYTGTQS